MPKVVGIKLTDADYADWKQSAFEAHLTIPAWVRRCVTESRKNSNQRQKKITGDMIVASNALVDSTPTIDDVVSVQTRKAMKDGSWVVCDHAGTEIGQSSGMGVCPKCGAWVSKKEVKR